MATAHNADAWFHSKIHSMQLLYKLQVEAHDQSLNLVIRYKRLSVEALTADDFSVPHVQTCRRNCALIKLTKSQSLICMRCSASNPSTPGHDVQRCAWICGPFSAKSIGECLFWILRQKWIKHFKTINFGRRRNVSTRGCACLDCNTRWRTARTPRCNKVCKNHCMNNRNIVFRRWDKENQDNKVCQKSGTRRAPRGSQSTHRSAFAWLSWGKTTAWWPLPSSQSARPPSPWYSGHFEPRFPG